MAPVLQVLLQGLQGLDQVLVLLSKVIPQQTLRTEGSTSPRLETPGPAVRPSGPLLFSPAALQPPALLARPSVQTKRDPHAAEPEARRGPPHGSVRPPPATPRIPQAPLQLQYFLNRAGCLWAQGGQWWAFL